MATLDALDNLFASGTALVLGLLLLGLILLLIGRFLRYRARPSPEAQQAVLRLIPVPKTTQDSVAALVREGKEGQALGRLRRVLSVSVPRVQARELLRWLGERPQPTGPREALGVLGEDHPELSAELRRLIQAGKQKEAVRLLRKQLPLDLVTAHQLASAQRHAEPPRPE